jgi:hypothetical protein
VDKLNQKRRLSIHVDLIRTVAIIGVIVLHATQDATSFDPQAPYEIWRWWTVDVYQSLSRVGVPLFVMLSGALLLQPSKIEPLHVFLKKRWARIGLPFLFWGAAYFAWDYFSKHITFTSSFIIQGVLSGPYFHFWYLYMLIGLYIFTPVLRVVVAHVSTSDVFSQFGWIQLRSQPLNNSMVGRLLPARHVPSKRANAPQNPWGSATYRARFNSHRHVLHGSQCWRNANLLLSRLLQPNNNFSINCAFPAICHGSAAFEPDGTPPPQS